VATVLVAVVATSAAMSGIGTGARAVTEGASAVAQGAMASPASSNFAYGIDKLFRSSGSGAATAVTLQSDPRAEAGHIIANAIATGSVPDADRAYLIDQVAARTGVSRADAQSRVDNFIAATMEAQAKVKADADAARKVAAQASIYLALSMLIGAFIASVAAALGGRLRDEHI